MTLFLRNVVKLACLIVLDLAALYTTLRLTVSTVSSAVLVSPDLFQIHMRLTDIFTIWWLPFIVLAFISYEGLYNRRLPFWDEARYMAKAVTISVGTVFVIMVLEQRHTDVSYATLLVFWFYGLVLFPFFRRIGKRLLFKIGVWRENIIIIGAGPTGIETAKVMMDQAHLGFHVIGFLDDAADRIKTNIEILGRRYKVFGKTRHFVKFATNLHITTAIIAMPSLPVDRLAKLTNTVQKHARNVLVVPDIKGIALANTELYHLFIQQRFFLNIKNNLKSPFNRFVKRMFDLMVSILFLPVLIPLIGLIGLLIKLESKGPALFRHMRVGRQGRLFPVFKFRSMFHDAEAKLAEVIESGRSSKEQWETFYKLKDDPRITRVGKFLRQTSLDELPQILNVIRGEMSLVGPRPVLMEELKRHYREYADYYYLVRPGITGLWQVSGRNDILYESRVKLDSWYILNWSLWIDVMILFKTIRVVLFKNGAY